MAVTATSFATGLSLQSVNATIYQIDADFKVAAANLVAGVSGEEGVAILGGRIESYEWDYEEKTENLTPMNVEISNPVAHESQVTLSLEVLLDNRGVKSGQNTLRGLMLSNNQYSSNPFSYLAKVALLVGSSATPNYKDTLIFWAKLNKYVEHGTKPKLYASAVFSQCIVYDSAGTNGSQIGAIGGLYASA